MRRILLFAGVLAAIALTAAAVYLSYASTRGTREMVGAVVASGAASVEATDQLGAQDAIVVSRVVVPGPSWVAVYSEGMDGMTGGLVAVVAIPAGESRDVRVPFDPNIRLSEYAIVVVHADRGRPGVFEFDDARFDESPDKPYWVDGKSLQTKVWVRFFEMGNDIRS